jgi:hypothetical protein
LIESFAAAFGRHHCFHLPAAQWSAVDILARRDLSQHSPTVC